MNRSPCQVYIVVSKKISATHLAAMNSIFIVLLIVAVNLDQSKCFPSGAPSTACSTLSPDPLFHGAQPQTSAVPYEVDLSAFDDGTGALSYVPGQTFASM